jgi:hypothetical protein
MNLFNLEKEEYEIIRESLRESANEIRLNQLKLAKSLTKDEYEKYTKYYSNKLSKITTLYKKLEWEYFKEYGELKYIEPFLENINDNVSLIKEMMKI